MSTHHRILLPLIPAGGWRTQATCAQRDVRLWDDRLDNETDQDRDERHERAKLICRTECPVRAECSDDADWRTDEGIRGGHKLPTLLGYPRSKDDEELFQLLRKGLSLDQAASRLSWGRAHSRSTLPDVG